MFKSASTNRKVTFVSLQSLIFTIILIIGAMNNINFTSSPDLVHAYYLYNIPCAQEVVPAAVRAVTRSVTRRSCHPDPPLPRGSH